MARSPITDVVQAFNNLTMDEQMVFLDLVDPKPDEEEEVKVAKKRKRAKGALKSTRATGMAAQLNKSLSADTRVPILCPYEIDGKVCHGTENDGIHDKSLAYGNYHPFVSSGRAPRAVGQSSTSGIAVSSETGKEDAANAVGGD